MKVVRALCVLLNALVLVHSTSAQPVSKPNSPDRITGSITIPGGRVVSFVALAGGTIRVEIGKEVVAFSAVHNRSTQDFTVTAYEVGAYGPGDKRKLPGQEDIDEIREFNVPLGVKRGLEELPGYEILIGEYIEASQKEVERFRLDGPALADYFKSVPLCCAPACNSGVKICACKVRDGRCGDCDSAGSC